MLGCDGGRNACRVEAERRIQEQAAHFTAMEEEYNQYIGALQEEYYHHIIALQEDQAPNNNVPCFVDVLPGQNVSYWELRIYTVSDIIIYDRN